MKLISVIGLSIVLLGAGLRSYAQTDDIISRFKAYNQSHPAEKAYLHFDKPYYAAGDTVYFKAYVTMGERHDLSKISRVLHVDLVNTANKIDQSIQLQLINGVAWGDFALPDSLPAGGYRIRAYTRWMQNWDNNSYFEKGLPVGTLHRQQVPESSTAKRRLEDNKPDLRFFPEGGDLVTGINSKIAFKAVGANGLGMNLKGEIIDNTGSSVASFQSARLGMGYFWLKPQEGKTYKASVTYADGTKDVLPLPQADARGITLSVNNDSLASATVRIEANPAYYQENKGRDYDLVVYSGGYVTTVNCRLDSPVIKMDIIKRRLFTGITTITLFSGSDPLCERLLFAQNYDQLNLDVKTDKDSYAPREKVAIKLNAKTRADSAAMGHFSVSVIDESKVPVDENTETTILTNLLLTSDLKGYIEQPNYYFTDVTDNKLKELDLVLLTHGYRRFEWKQVLNDTDKSAVAIAYQPERSLAISGTAKNLLGKPLAKATVSLISLQPRQLISDTTDSKGHFSFGNLLFTDTAKFILQAVNAKGKNKTQLTYDQPKPPAITPAMISQSDNTNRLMTAYLENDEKEQEELNRLGLGKAKMLKEVKIRSVKKDNDYVTSSLAGAGNADQVMHRDQITQIQGPLSTSLNGRLIGVKFIPKQGYGFTPVLTSPPGGAMLVVIDGVEGADMSDLQANDVETVEVLRFAGASMYGMRGSNGVIVITTRRGQGLSAGDIASIGILPITAKGFYRAREFYSPKYEHPDDNLSRKDLRSTIYWQPELVTNKEGNASIDYYNADGRGNYRVVIEGIDAKGNIGRQVYRYKVE